MLLPAETPPAVGVTVVGYAQRSLGEPGIAPVTSGGLPAATHEMPT